MACTWPSRELRRIARRVRELKLDRQTVHAGVKSAAKRCAAPPLRWLIARRRLRAVVDPYLPRFPALERRVSGAIQGITVNAARPPRDRTGLALQGSGYQWLSAML
jgi:hypothetical protein